ncbi:MAG: hypothetical protein ACLGIN_05285 [Candidatus Sericytochromatia bacterium]
MSSVYDQQVKKLVDHIQSLNQALHERNMQIVHWQQVARTLQDERARVARGLLDQVRQALAGFSTRFQGLRSENKKLRTYVDHQKQLHESVARDLQGQLQYALARIEELASERSEWRNELNVTRTAAIKYQQQVQEQKGVINSQQAALAELRAQLESAQGFEAIEASLQAEIDRLQEALKASGAELSAREQALSAKEREVIAVQSAFDGFKIKANEEVAALEKELSQHRNQQDNADDRADELTKLLANSEREVANLFKELSKERELRKELEIRYEAASKELTSSKRKVTRLEKDRESAKSAKMADMHKQFDDMKSNNEKLQETIAKLQEELVSALADKTQYMKAVEGQKGKLRSVDKPAEQ